MKKATFIILAFLGLMACDRDKIGPQNLNPAPAAVLEGRQVFVLNEGNFQRGNASVSAYQPEDKEVQHQIFSSFNGGLPLGDVAQDFIYHQGRYYLSLNGSGSVRVIDSISWQAIAEVSINGTPTYLASVNNTLYVSDLFKKKIWLVDLTSLQVSGSINTPAPPSYLQVWQEKVLAVAGKKLLLIDPVSIKIESQKDLPGAGGRMVSDAQNHLWILTSGKRNERALVRLNKPEDSLRAYALGNAFPAASAKHLNISGIGETLFMTYENQVFTQPLNDSIPKLQALFGFSVQTLYGFGVDPLSGDFYLSDALDFDQAAEVYRYDSSGSLIHSFKVGPIANRFHFQ